MMCCPTTALVFVQFVQTVKPSTFLGAKSRWRRRRRRRMWQSGVGVVASRFKKQQDGTPNEHKASFRTQLLEDASRACKPVR
jgi:hypothetical protein